MTFVFFSFDGAIFSVAYKMKLEGYDVHVCQISNPEVLGIKSWVSDTEAPEAKKRRLSLYDGLIKKYPYEVSIAYLRRQSKKADFFIIFDHSNLAKVSESVLKMGYTNGLFPTMFDYNLEKDRKKGKEFVKKHYPGLKLVEVKSFAKVDDVIKFVEESDKLWVIKSDGNFGDTLVPDHDDIEMGKQQVIYKLEEDRKDYEKGKIIAEEKIINPIEFNAEMVFYDGNPVYSQVEIETRMFGCCDIGPQTGGNQNLTISTQFSDKINHICFPRIVYDEAAERKGMYIRDAGILSDGEDLYFCEFAGNRWGWGGIFSELSASMDGKEIGQYFTDIMNGINPYTHKFGTSLALYSLDPDPKFVNLPLGDMQINIREGEEHNFFIVQTKQNKKRDGLVTVGYRWFGSSPIGYVTGRGDTVPDAVNNLYKNLENFSLKGVYYRSKSDFLSMENCKHVLRRLEFLREKQLILDI